MHPKCPLPQECAVSIAEAGGSPFASTHMWRAADRFFPPTEMVA